MDFRLSQQQTQKLILSPQIQQYLKLLQLPLTELTHSVEQELTENPVLEYDEDSENSPTEESINKLEEPEADKESDSEELEFQERFNILEKLDENFKENYSASDTQHESLEDLEKKHDFQSSLITEQTTLNDFLDWQINFLDFNDTEKKIVEEMIGNLSPDGYYRVSLDEVAEIFQVTPAKIEQILATLQTLDPPGIFGRNLREVLTLQIERKPANEINKLAFRILEEHFDLFEKRNMTALTKALQITPEKLKLVVTMISSLEPKPGRVFYQDENVNIVPDVTISPPEEDGEYIIDVHQEGVPSLRISSYYKNLIKNKDTDAKTKEYIKQKINAGFWFIKAIDQRKSTLRQISEQIVEVQREFFEKGFSYLKPLTLRDIAEKINIHESTVSRALSGKYVSTPQGTIPFKSFFSNRLTTYDGDDESQKSVMEKLRTIIESEDPKKPFSDSKLVTLMKDDGIKIARRTVAKYRELMKILPSHLRKIK